MIHIPPADRDWKHAVRSGTRAAEALVEPG
jgi:hypothetical protein